MTVAAIERALVGKDAQAVSVSVPAAELIPVATADLEVVRRVAAAGLLEQRMTRIVADIFVRGRQAGAAAQIVGAAAEEA